MVYSCKCWTCVILCMQNFDIANVAVWWMEQKETFEKIMKKKILQIYSITEPATINEVCGKCLLFMPSIVTETFSWINFPYLFFCSSHSCNILFITVEMYCSCKTILRISLQKIQFRESWLCLFASTKTLSRSDIDFLDDDKDYSVHFQILLSFIFCICSMYIIISHMHGARYTSFSYPWYWEDCPLQVKQAGRRQVGRRQAGRQAGRKWHRGQFQ